MDPILFAAVELALFIGIFTTIYWLWFRPNLFAAARKEAEMIGKQALLQAREDAVRMREDAEAEIRQKQAAIAKLEERLQGREDALATAKSAMDQEAQELNRRCQGLEAQEEGLLRQYEKLSQLTKEDARALLLAQVEKEAFDDVTRRAKSIEEAALSESGSRVQKIVLDAMQRSSVDYVTEATLSVIPLPSEDMKGRIIGREGRNIRAFEQVTGVDLIIDDTPEAVVISCFDPVRREAARITLLNLIKDGRIHPARIEEVYEKSMAEVEASMLQEGVEAADRAGVAGLPQKVCEALGRLKYRTSYAQNVLVHSVEVAHLGMTIGRELGLDVEVIRRAGLLHDIGKALGSEWEGPHALSGMNFLKTFGESEKVLNAVGAHHYEIEPSSPEATVVIIADQISAARPGARRESLENYIQRLAALEEIAKSFPGVEKTFAVQAGRELRIVVKPEVLDDQGAARLAKEVAARIQAELQVPGQVRVTVIRETRVHEVVK